MPNVEAKGGTMAVWDFRSQNPREVQDFLGGIYAENEFRVFPRRGQPTRTRIYGSDVGEVAQYHTSHSSPFTFVSEKERDTFLVVSCTAGEARYQRGNDCVELRPGVTTLVSASRESRVHGREGLAHISTHINAASVNAACSRLIGAVIDEPVLFDQVPFTAPLKRLWDSVVKSLSYLTEVQALPGVAVNALIEYAITLLLEHHPHNYSEMIQRPAAVTARAVAEAQEYIEQNADRDLSVAEVAASINCSIQALHQGFCRLLGLTPRAYLHLVRVQLRIQTVGVLGSAPPSLSLSRPCDSGQHGRQSTVVALENPTDAFLRHLSALGGTDKNVRDRSPGALTPAKVSLLRHHINSGLGKRLTVEKLASLVCMSPQAFAPAFKKAFKTTPAQYILVERLRWARWVLENTDTPISTVAAEAGFSSQSHLTSTFKQRLGATPREFRISISR